MDIRYRNINEFINKDNIHFVGTDDKDCLYCEIVPGQRLQVFFWRMREGVNEILEPIPEYQAKGIIHTIKRKQLPIYFNAELWMNIR